MFSPYAGTAEVLLPWTVRWQLESYHVCHIGLCEAFVFRLIQDNSFVIHKYTTEIYLTELLLNKANNNGLICSFLEAYISQEKISPLMYDKRLYFSFPILKIAIPWLGRSFWVFYTVCIYIYLFACSMCPCFWQIYNIYNRYQIGRNKSLSLKTRHLPIKWMKHKHRTHNTTMKLKLEKHEPHNS